MRYVKACATLLVLTQAFPARAQPHLTTSSAIDARLAAAHTQRERDLAELNRFLETDAARARMAALRVDPRVVSKGLTRLDDDELRDLAARQRRLAADPAAGTDWGDGPVLLNLILVAVGIVLAYAVLIFGSFFVACTLGDCSSD